jgi:hydrogenase maturation protein HypF
MLLPGGEAAINEPFRMAIACCLDSIGVNASNLPLVVWSELSDDGKSLFMQFLEKRINSPLTSSCGRLFDAVAALLGVRGIISYEGQAAIELESVACGGVAGKTYPYDVSEVDGIFEIDWRQMFASILTDIGSSCATSDIALNFHITMAKASLDVCRKIRYYDGLKKVVLSGGVFQNRLLTEHLCDLLLNDKFEVFTHRLVPPNDGGLALGQAVIACRR